MFKEAIEKIVSLAGASTFDICGRTFADRELHEVREELDMPSTEKLFSLDALVKKVKAEAVETSPALPVFVSVSKYNEVECSSRIVEHMRSSRILYYVAHASDIPGLEANSKFGFEQAQIALQTRFQPTPDRDYLLRLCSQITCGGKVTYNDNGIATSIITQKGVALQGTEAIKPLVSLKPYRTFQEVEQPESLFLIRVDERGVSFIEADGGMWKLAARQTVKKFLEEELSALVEAGDVIVTL